VTSEVWTEVESKLGIELGLSGNVARSSATLRIIGVFEFPRLLMDIVIADIVILELEAVRLS
jgi:hypothetical protein